jgi:hypothetical protein
MHACKLAASAAAAAGVAREQQYGPLAAVAWLVLLWLYSKPGRLRLVMQQL